MRTVSIITVTKNNVKGLRNTLLSILNQKKGCYELVIKDGLSDDATKEIVDEFEKKFKQSGHRFVFYQCADKGIYDAMNQALTHCGDTDYVLFLNAGDTFYDEDVLFSIDKMLTDDDSDIIMGLANTILYKKRSFVVKPNIDLNKLFFCHQAVLIKTELMKRNRFAIEFKVAADRDLLLRLLKAGYKSKALNLIIANYMRDGVSTRRFDYYYKDIDLINKKHGIADKKHNELVSVIKTCLTRINPLFADIAYIYKRSK